MHSSAATPLPRHHLGDFPKMRPTGSSALRLLFPFLTVLLLSAGPVFPVLASEDLPNVMVILSDDHRWDAMSSTGHPFIQTPNLDRLADEGILFENAFVTTSLCSPSRASFLTGQYAHTHGVRNNLTPWNNENVTFLELLKHAGYRTAFIGKWHMPGPLPKLRGVDRFITFTIQAGQGRYFRCPLIVDGKEVPSRKPYITEELTDRAVEFIRSGEGNPFCLFLSHKAVHHQFKPPPDLDDLYEEAPLALPPEADPWIAFTKGQIWSGVFGPIQPHYRNYCETVVALDQEIGRLLRELDRLGLTRNTIVVYASDNGYFWGEHRLLDKRWAYEESIRIPMIIRYPAASVRPGTRAKQMVLNVDVAPTLLDLAGVPPPPFMEGRSMTPILRDTLAPWRDAWLYEYFKDFPYNVPELRAVRTDHFKYIDYQGRMPDELFDVIYDPREKQNLWNSHEAGEQLPILRQLLEDLRERKHP